MKQQFLVGEPPKGSFPNGRYDEVFRVLPMVCHLCNDVEEFLRHYNRQTTSRIDDENIESGRNVDSVLLRIGITAGSRNFLSKLTLNVGTFPITSMKSSSITGSVKSWSTAILVINFTCLNSESFTRDSVKWFTHLVQLTRLIWANPRNISIRYTRLNIFSRSVSDNFGFSTDRSTRTFSYAWKIIQYFFCIVSFEIILSKELFYDSVLEIFKEFIFFCMLFKVVFYVPLYH